MSTHAFDHVGDDAVPLPAASFRLATAGVLRLRDRDRLALLHRLSTNHLERLTPGSGAQTVLTTPIGRMIDLLRVLVLDDMVLIVTGPDNGAKIARHIKRNIFFNDRLAVDDQTSATAVFALIGPAVDDALSRLGLTLPPTPFAVVAAELHGDAVVIQRGGPDAAAALLLVPAAAEAAWAARLAAAEVPALSEESWQVLRVERGEAAVPNEISEEFIPLETGLWSAVSFAKGCYVGQEIIARMESRGRLAKQLRRVQIAAVPASLPQALSVAGKDAGVLTSAVLSPRYGPIGLAYIRTAFVGASAELQLPDGTGVVESMADPSTDTTAIA